MEASMQRWWTVRCSAAATLLAVAGCASTNVDRANDLSSAGIQYARTTSAVVDLAIDSGIDADSAAEIRRMPRPAALPAPEVRTKQLETLDAGLLDSTLYYSKLRASIGALDAYFKGLQALANGSQADATQAAVATLADRVNALNKTLEGGSATVKPVLTDAQKSALAGLSKVVAKQVHGAVVAKALERDADTIGRALALQQQVLVAAEGDIAGRIADANARFYVDRVLKPYQAGTMDASWADNRRTYIKTRALGETLDAVKSAEAASRQMQVTWARILAGDTSPTELLASLREADELLAAVQALKAAEKK
jgi:hypothetical protein